MADRALTGNAGDIRQVRRAERKEKEYGDRLLYNLTQVLKTPAGRATIWELLRGLRIYDGVWHHEPGRLSFNVGQLEFGQFLRNRCAEADEDLLQLMEREGRAYQRREDLATEAAQTTPETEE